MRIVLSGEPLSTNNVYRYHCQFGRAAGYMSAEGKARKTDYAWQARGQYHGTPLAVGLRLTATLYFGRRGKRDADNYNKLVLDALTGIVWEDDSQIEDLRVVKSFDKANPRIELAIEQMAA
jgi:crossover junction endodeoxyribonuclease RusA